ncbi:hypothetical protein OSB04_016579 [Centaurea solstitialis]|uniref:Uncharacterized protein n=1 Tax=Centaurea solstitialis TaxID=347529 RepID=A0AA38T2V8_9ASTR|nr:hypothetical protein OSB04_016579 [Centaurea solstitialis]
MENNNNNNNVDIESEGTIEKLERNGSTFEEIREPLLLKSRVNTTSQIAIVGANISPSSLLITKNDLFKQDWRSRKKVQIFQYVVLKWTLVLLIGVATGLVAFFNNIAVENIAGFKLLLTGNLMLKQNYYQAFAALAGCNVILATCAGVLCAYVAPAAAGSGIPEVKAYLNGVDAHSILAPSTLFVKTYYHEGLMKMFFFVDGKSEIPHFDDDQFAQIFGSIFGVAAGFVVGKEGPMVHTGACIANLLGQGGSRKYHLTWNWLRFFKNDRDRRDLITCGAAAGVAAAFRAPVGGVLFALEEAASWWRSALLWRTFFTTAVVAVVLKSLIEYCKNGQCGLFGDGGLIMRGPGFRVLLVITISILTSCCAFGVPWLARCIPCPDHLKEECPTKGRSGSYKSFQCPDGHYNDLASLLLTTNDDAIRSLFSSLNTNEFRLSSLIFFFVAMYFLGIITYGIAIPSGLFIPENTE